MGDARYSPLVTFDGKILFNASHVSNSTGNHNRVISMDKPNMKVKMKLARGFYEGFPILYSTTETSDNDIAAMLGAKVLSSRAAMSLSDVSVVEYKIGKPS